MSDQEKLAIQEAKNTANSRKETECAICLEEMEKKKVVLLCTHAYCAPCMVNFVRSKNLR